MIAPTPEEQSAERSEEAARERCEAGLCDPKTCRREASPADYYRRKQQEVDEILDEISRHQLDECNAPSGLCITCKELEKRLDAARYVGD